MSIEPIATCCAESKNRRQQSSASILLLAISAVLCVITTGCSKREQLQSVRNPELMRQISSFSISGRDYISVVLKGTHELKLSHDGGETWQIIPPAAVAGAFECATMIDGQRGWAVNHLGHVFSTVSGGATWTKIAELQEFTGASEIHFLNEKDGWLRESLSLSRTNDGGVTWRKVLSTLTPDVVGQPTGMFPVNAEILAGSGSGGQVYLSKDGGETWRIQAPLVADNLDFNDVWFVNRMHGWLAGYQVVVAGESLRPLLFETTDGGDSWRQINVSADILPSSVCFVSNEGWLAGSRRIQDGDSIRLEGVLMRTEDGGLHWEQVELGPNEPFLTDVRFADKEHGWLVGRDTLYRTEDGGKTWKRVLSLAPPATH